MATVHITEGELARDLHSILARVQQGVEVVVREESRAIAVIRAPATEGRLISECIALAEARGTSVHPDDEFMNDVEEGISARTKPWSPPDWE